VHPNKTTEVIHPDYLSGKGTIHNRGSVCGIEQIKGSLRFVVEFGSYRELWNGRKVRKYGVASERTDEEFKLMYLSHEAEMTVAKDNDSNTSAQASSLEALEPADKDGVNDKDTHIYVFPF
jgi:hypothetical protein